MKIELIDNILTPEDFIRLRVTTGFADIPAPHARKALQNGLLNVSAVKDIMFLCWYEGHVTDVN